MWFFLLLLAYLLGSFPTAHVISWYFYGVDIRRRGSGNVGATNVLRTLGPLPGFLVLAVDIWKGVLPAWLGLKYGCPWLAAGAGLAALVGHNWSIFLGFQGGKGVATAAGAVLIMAPKILLVLLLIWLLVVLLSRYVSLGSITAAFLAPWLLIFTGQPPYVLYGIIAAVIIMWRHYPNIKRLRAGTEHRLGERL
ncbi:MAG TPA: glycerol-3-phosphate 1-O-acyltransferase [Moorella mulderi]|nr:glycerol-3-phosphate 1-O-acyltransferase [Moorella mulderi]